MNLKFLNTLAFLSGFMIANTVCAQREQGIFVEFLGSSTSVGVHYDTRFNDYTSWGGESVLPIPILNLKIFLSLLQSAQGVGVSP